MALLCGLMMPQERPACKAMVKKVLFTASRPGRPKEILDTPITVLMPRAFMVRITSQAISAFSAPVEMVSAKGSTTILRLSMPYSAARAIILSATAMRPAAVLGMPLSSRQRATSTAPYFLAKGRTLARLSSLPLTEFSIGLPLYRRSARSIAS